MTDNKWDMAEEVTARQEMKDAIAANDALLRGIPYPRFNAKGCADGAHLMRRDVAGLRCWECVRCQVRRPFHVDGETR